MRILYQDNTQLSILGVFATVCSQNGMTPITYEFLS